MTDNASSNVFCTRHGKVIGTYEDHDKVAHEVGDIIRYQIGGRGIFQYEIFMPVGYRETIPPGYTIDESFIKESARKNNLSETKIAIMRAFPKRFSRELRGLKEKRKSARKEY